MFHSQTTATKQRNTPASLTSHQAAQQELHPFAGALGSHNFLSRSAPGQTHSDLAQLHRAYGNQAILRMLDHGDPALSSGALQRKCTCSEAGQECKACQEQEKQYPWAMNKAVGLGDIAPSIHGQQIHTILNSKLGVEKQIVLGSDVDAPKYTAEGLEMDLAPPCEQGGGGSTCDPNTGKYGLVSNDNTCCTRDCTAQHEAKHKADHDAWGCCKALGVAWNKKGADKAKLVQQYEEWRAKVSPITECHAYSNDVICADSLAKSKDCDGKGKGSECCEKIATYREGYGKRAKENCDKAPKDAPPCPAF